MARPKKFDETTTLQKALTVFWRKGYSGTSMADLVESMNINAPSLYATYGDKKHLFLSALRSYQQSQEEWMNELVAQPLPVRDIIRQLLNSLLNDSLTDPERKGCFMVNTTTELANQDPEVLQIVTENDRNVRKLLTELIRKGQAAGEISADKNPVVLATYLFTLIMGLRVVAATNPDRSLLEATLDTIIPTI